MAFERGGRNSRGIRPEQEMWTQNFVVIQPENFLPPVRGRECGFWSQNVGLHCEPANQNSFLPCVPGINNVSYGKPRPEFGPQMYDSKNNGNKNLSSLRTPVSLVQLSLKKPIFLLATSFKLCSLKFV